jgi:hypothetical protein
MSTKPGSSIFGLKSGLALLAVAIAAVLAFVQARPTARVVSVNKGKAVNAVPGSVVVRAAYDQPLVCEVAGRVLEADFNLDSGQESEKGTFSRESTRPTSPLKSRASRSRFGRPRRASPTVHPRSSPARPPRRISTRPSGCST